MPRRTAGKRRLLPAGRPPAGGKSLSESLAAGLQEVIESGGLAVGDLVPAERELARRHRVPFRPDAAGGFPRG